MAEFEQFEIKVVKPGEVIEGLRIPMLSQENIDKLHMKGIYQCKPVLEWLPKYKRDRPYWCRNWTFKVSKYDDKYYMTDTYWNTFDNCIELTDENFDKFEYLFDLNEVQYVNEYSRWLEYPEEDRWIAPLDSGGMTHSKYVVRRGAKKVKERVIERLQHDIDCLKADLSHKERTLERVINNEIDWNWV